MISFRRNELRTPLRYTSGVLFIIFATQAFTYAAKLGAPVDRDFVAIADGSTQRYVEMLPENFDPAKEHHLLIALHGHGSDRWQAINSEYEEFKAARDIAAKYEMIYVSPDYRAKTSWMGPAAEADLVQIIAELRKRYKIEKSFLTGASMGGSSALTFTALHSKLIAGVCSQNGTANHLEFENFQEAIATSFGGSKSQIPLEYKKRSAESWPKAFHMPVAISAGGKDATVPPQSVLRLAKALSKRKRPVFLIYREEGGHNTSYRDTLESLEFVIGSALGTNAAKPREPRH